MWRHVFVLMLIAHNVCFGNSVQYNETAQSACACHLVLTMYSYQMERQIMFEHKQSVESCICEEYLIAKGLTGTAIRLHIERLVANDGDYLEIKQTTPEYDYRQSSIRLQRLVGHHTGEQFTATDGHGFHLVFHSRHSQSHFAASVTRFTISSVPGPYCSCPPLHYDAQREPLNITSPNYPNAYCKRIKCLYHITTLLGKGAVELNLLSIDMNQGQDTIRVYEVLDLYLLQRNLLAEWSGTLDTVMSRTVVSKTMGFIIVFESDTENPRNGFVLQYMESESPCECSNEHTYVMPGHAGFVTSPKYPNAYCEGLRCIYNLVTNPGYVIQYKMDYCFFLQSSNTDVIIITENIAERIDVTYLCHKTEATSQYFTTNKRNSSVYFHVERITEWTTSTMQKIGFNMTYKAIKRPTHCHCPPVNEMPGTIPGSEGTIVFQQALDCLAIDCAYELSLKNATALFLNFSVQAPRPHGKLTFYDGPGIVEVGSDHISFTKETKRLYRIQPSALNNWITMHYHSSPGAKVTAGSGFNVHFHWTTSCLCGETLKATAYPRTVDYATSSFGAIFGYVTHCSTFECSYTIETEPTGRIVFEVDLLEMKSADTNFPSPLPNVLTFYEGPVENESMEIERYSKDGTYSTVIKSQGPALTVHYTTNLESFIDYTGHYYAELLEKTEQNDSTEVSFTEASSHSKWFYISISGLIVLVLLIVIIVAFKFCSHRLHSFAVSAPRNYDVCNSAIDDDDL